MVEFIGLVVGGGRGEGIGGVGGVGVGGVVGVVGTAPHTLVAVFTCMSLDMLSDEIVTNSGNNDSHDVSGGFSTIGRLLINLFLWCDDKDVFAGVDELFEPGGRYAEDDIYLEDRGCIGVTVYVYSTRYL